MHYKRCWDADVQSSMMLINSLLSHATEAHWEDLITSLERLNVSKAVVRMMSSHTIEDLTSSILDFQANMVRVVYKRKTTPIDLEDDAVRGVLGYVWAAAKVDDDDSPGEVVREEDGLLMVNGSGGAAGKRPADVRNGFYKWRKLGFESEDLKAEFAGVGLLGLECLVRLQISACCRHSADRLPASQKQFVMADADWFGQKVLEQNSRPVERRCPLARASNEVVEILSEYWAVFAPGCGCLCDLQRITY